MTGAQDAVAVIQARVVVTGLSTVNVRRPGTYTITYTVTDTTGYAAVPVTRTVVVRGVQRCVAAR